jgi:hypothetical protein
VNIYIPLRLAGYEVRTGNRRDRADGRTFKGLNITTEYKASFQTKNKLMSSFTSVLNMVLRFGENLRHVFLKKCEFTFEVLALPIFLKLLKNLKSGDNNRKRGPDVSHHVDILILCE